MKSFILWWSSYSVRPSKIFLSTVGANFHLKRCSCWVTNYCKELKYCIKRGIFTVTWNLKTFSWVWKKMHQLCISSTTVWQRSGNFKMEITYRCVKAKVWRAQRDTHLQILTLVLSKADETTSRAQATYSYTCSRVSFLGKACGQEIKKTNTTRLKIAKSVAQSKLFV